MARKIELPDRDNLAQLYHSGKTGKQLAEMFGVSYSLMISWLSGYGIRRDRLPVPDRDEIALRYAAGETIRDIAISYGGSEPWMQRHFARYGIPTRHGSISLTAKIRHAATVEQRQLHISDLEREFRSMLGTLGAEFSHQKAVGPYNVDLTSGSVAVEIFGGGWHNVRDGEGERLSYLLDRGWSVVIIWVDSVKHPLSIDAAKYVVSHLDLSERDPSAVRGYRVIRGSGELLAQGFDGDDVPDVITRCYRLDIPESVPYGTCRCGCGRATWIADVTNVKRGWVKGEPVTWAQGHQVRGSKWRVVDGRRQYSR